MNSERGAASSGSPDSHGRFSYFGLDRVLHEKARLGILTSLVSHPEGLLFNDLKQLCSLTDGNLSRHLSVLEEADLIEVWKGVQRGRSQTMYRFTHEGRERFLEYIRVLERVVEDAHAAERQQQENRETLGRGWSPA
jgi:DNA-binding transcriptional ArsR family regulator